MDTQAQRAAYPYGTFAKIAEAVGATHTSTRRKIHHWDSDRYSLTYFAKERAFTVARADVGPLVTVDATLTPGIVGPLTDEERRILAAAGLPIDAPTRPDAPGRAQPTATTEHPTPDPIAPETSTPPRIPAPTKPRRTATPKPATAPKPAPPADDEPAAAAAPAEGIRVSVQAFRDALKATKGSVLTKTALPILQCAVIDYADGWMTITTTNLETAVQRRLPAVGATPARYAIDHKALSGLTADKSASWVITPAAPHGATFTSPTGAVTLAGMDTADYPALPAVPSDAPSATIYREIAARAFTNAAAAAAKDDSRPVLAGIHLDTRDGAPAMLYAADGFRANACPLDYEGELPDVIVPARFAAVLSKAIEPDARALTVTSDGPTLAVISDRTTVTTRTIEGTHPDMRQIFPREFGTVATLPRAAMLAAAEQAEKIAKNNNDVVVLTADPAANTLTVSAKTAEGGSYSAAVPMTDYRGDANPAKIAFNGNYLIDALKAAGDTHVELRTNTPHTPGIIADSVDRFLLMPMVVRPD